VTVPREDWLVAVAASLRGPRRRRRRLLAELEGHLEDAAAEELAAGANAADAEAAAVRRLGSPAKVVESWNADVAARRSIARLRVVVVAVLVGALAAPVALARSGNSSPRPPKPPPAAVKRAHAAAPARAS
jgi:hypothetical protein